MSIITRKDKPLPPHRQHQLALAAQQGCENSREELIRTNRGFLAQQANLYAGRGVEFDDLMQAAATGMLKGIDKYDPSRGKLLTCCGQWVRQALGRACESSGTMQRYGYRVPADVTYLQAKIRREMESNPEMAACSDVEKWMEFTGKDAQLVELALKQIQRSRVNLFDDEGRDGEQVSLPDLEADTPEQATIQTRTKQVRQLLGMLDERSREVLEREMVGESMPAGLTVRDRENIREQALELLRAHAGEVGLVPDSVDGDLVLAESMITSSCGHLTEDATVPALVGMGFEPVAGTFVGRQGGFWWLISCQGDDFVPSVEIQDGPDGEIHYLADALDICSGEQREELIRFASQLPLAHASSCACCNEQR